MKLTIYFLIIYVSFLYQSAFASETVTPSPTALLEETCREEIKTLCPNLQGPRFLISCLKQEQDKISVPCKEEMSRLSDANRQLKRRSGGSLSGFGGFSMTPTMSPNVSYEGKTLPGNQSPSVSENKFNFSTPLVRAGSQSLSLSTQAGLLHFNEGLTLNNSVILPTDYYRTELGLSYMNLLQDKKSFGVRTSFGYNTDRPFKSERDLSFSLSSHYSFQSSEESSWALTLYLSNNGPFANYIPTPGFIYFYRTATFTGIFGLPFLSLQWTPSSAWIYSVSLFGLNFNSEIAYGDIEKAQYFGGFNWTRQSYMLHDRTNRKDRLTFLEEKIFLGIRTPLFTLASSEFQIGEAFGRKAYIGAKFLNKAGGKATMNSSLYANWSMRLIF